ncbi:MAG: hypothetical protein RMK84_20975, partial [Oscillochloridaceae bacterium]|nr:hypothetical protein [Oscillochloridaceae bacterium]
AGEAPGARRRPLEASPERVADDLAALPPEPPPAPKTGSGLGRLIGVAALAGVGLLALDLWAFVEARFAANPVQGWAALVLVLALAAALAVFAWREWRGVKRLAAAEAVARSFREPVTLLPAGLPPHRPPPHAPAEARLALIEAACRKRPWLRVDPRELARPGPSWTVDSL